MSVSTHSIPKYFRPMKSLPLLLAASFLLAPSLFAADLPKEKVFEVNGVEFKVRLIPAGTYIMGAPETEDGREDDENPHEVTLTKSYYMMETEVTNALFKAVTGSLPATPGGFDADADQLPVTMLSVDRAADFCRALSEKLGVVFRLPTEAEWEYACRAGTQTAYYWGDEMDPDYAWSWMNSGGKPNPVAQKRPNAFGLYDMSGNVWEWTSDFWGLYPEGPVTDPEPRPKKGKAGMPVFRGGGFGLNFRERDDYRFLRSAERNAISGPQRDVGFRALLEVE
jgi:formylglycine-generating enzyme required for sulfatase activity